MTEEIKESIKELEILITALDGTERGEEHNAYTVKCIKNVIDYITNLQQLYENALKVNQNTEKYRTELESKYVLLQQENEFLKLNNPEMNIEHFRIVKENKRKIDNLRKENKRLKEKINTLKSNFEVEIDDCENYKKWYRDYKSRCEKVIEYINFVINHYKEQLETPIEDTYFDSDVNRKGYILSIIAYLQTALDTLNGSDEK